MKRLQFMTAIVMVTACLLMGCGASENKENAAPKESRGKSAGEKYQVEIQVKDYGTISMELDTTYTPITVENFVKLTESGFMTDSHFTVLSKVL